MAFRLRRAVAFSSQDGNMFDATTGSPTVQTTVSSPNTGQYVLLNATSEAIQVWGDSPEIPTDSAGTHFAISFKFRCSSSTFTLWAQIEDNSGNSLGNIRLTETQIILNDQDASEDTYSFSYSQDTDYDLVLWLENSSSGSAKAFLNGTEILSTTTGNFSRTVTVAHRAEFSVGSASSVYIGEVALWDGDSSLPTDINEAGYDVHEYIVAGAFFSSSGDLPTNFWDTVGDQPLDETLPATYSGTPLAGHADTDGTSMSGPSGDGITGVIAGSEWWYWSKRGNGGGTTHTLRYGNSADTINTEVFEPITDYAPYMIASQAAGAVPLSTEYFAMGMEVDGAKDLFMAEMYAALVVEVGAAAGSLVYSNNLMKKLLLG